MKDKDNTKQSKKISSSSNNQTITTKKNVSSKLDLRGERYEDASDLIDKFLDDNC